MAVLWDAEFAVAQAWSIHENIPYKTRKDRCSAETLEVANLELGRCDDVVDCIWQETIIMRVQSATHDELTELYKTSKRG